MLDVLVDYFTEINQTWLSTRLFWPRATLHYGANSANLYRLRNIEKVT